MLKAAAKTDWICIGAWFPLVLLPMTSIIIPAFSMPNTTSRNVLTTPLTDPHMRVLQYCLPCVVRVEFL